jgi:hypothetical protein
VSVGSDKKDEFNTIQTGFYNALKLAGNHGIRKLVAPAMGTGIIGQLTAEQSARAMMSALDQYTKEGGASIDVSFVIYGDKEAYQAFADTLKSRSYENATREKGEAKFDSARLVEGMIKDADANQKTWGDRNQKRDPNSPDGTGWGKNNLN